MSGRSLAGGSRLGASEAPGASVRPASFPFGIASAPTDEGGGEEGRGPDTANRLLLHGARHHDREAVFHHWGQGRKGWGWQGMPDWRADRASVRAALVLHQRVRIEEGERVALWLPLGPELVVLERAVWSIGTVSIPVWPEWPLERVAEVLFDAAPAVLFAPSLDALHELEAIGGRPESVETVVCMRAPGGSGDEWISHASFLEYGGVLDTPERASMWRTFARRLAPSTPACLEYGSDRVAWDGRGPSGRPREVDQGELAEWAAGLARALGGSRRAARVVATERPGLVARLLVLAGWADGLTETAFAGGGMEREHVAELRPELIASRSQDAEFWLGVLADVGGSEPGRSRGGARGWRARLGLRRSDRETDDPRTIRRARRLIVLDDDRPQRWKRPAEGIAILTAAELWSEASRSREEVAQTDRSDPGAVGA